MAERKIPGWLKTALEFGPVLAFFAAFFLLKGESYVLFGNEVKTFTYITFWFMVLMVICMGVLRGLTGSLSRMQMVTLVLVLVLGGLTVFLDNDLFLKLKPSILYGLFAGILGAGLMRGKSYLAQLMEGLLPMRHEGWMILTKRFVIFFLALAVANVVVAFTLSSGVWVTVKTFGLPIAFFAFMLSQYKVLERYGLEEKKEEE